MMDKLKQFEFGVIPKSPPKNNLLYHYTDSKGLFGITTSGTLWATKLQYLNDSKEFRHAVEIAKLELDVRKSRKGLTDDEDFLYSLLYARVESMKGANTFICSLSEEPDLLSQWRAYGGKGGYSIGFDYDKLIRLAHKQSFRLLPCIYELDKQKDLINYLIDEIKNMFFSDPTRYKDSLEKQRLQNKFYSPFLLMASTMKHPSFYEEKEWRLIGGPFRYDSNNARWRPTESKLLPYYIFDLKKDDKYAIDNIFIGPNNNRDLVIKSTNTFISSMKKGWNTNYSNSPFRMKG